MSEGPQNSGVRFAQPRVVPLQVSHLHLLQMAGQRQQLSKSDARLNTEPEHGYEGADACYMLKNSAESSQKPAGPEAVLPRLDQA